MYIHKNNMKSDYLTIITTKINSHTEITSPLDQFEIRNLISLDLPVLNNLHISLTNIGLYLSIAVFTALILSILATNYDKIVSNN
jgi:F-type H+-transporting ATPase subunit a